jgi:hypothetical protein
LPPRSGAGRAGRTLPPRHQGPCGPADLKTRCHRLQRAPTALAQIGSNATGFASGGHRDGHTELIPLVEDERQSGDCRAGAVTHAQGRIEPGRGPRGDDLGFNREERTVTRAVDRLLDHVIGARQQRLRDGQAEGLGGLEIDE